MVPLPVPPTIWKAPRVWVPFEFQLLPPSVEYAGQSHRALVVQVPGFPGGVVNVHRSDYQPVVVAGSQIDAGDAGDGDDAAALTKGSAAGQVAPVTQLGSGLAVVVLIQGNVEGVDAGDVADCNINLGDAAAHAGRELVSSGEAGSDGASTGNSPTGAAVVHITRGTEVRVEVLRSCHGRKTGYTQSEKQQAKRPHKFCFQGAFLRGSKNLCNRPPLGWHYQGPNQLKEEFVLPLERALTLPPRFRPPPQTARQKLSKPMLQFCVRCNLLKAGTIPSW